MKKLPVELWEARVEEGYIIISTTENMGYRHWDIYEPSNSSDNLTRCDDLKSLVVNEIKV